jgi:hypothetical protein
MIALQGNFTGLGPRPLLAAAAQRRKIMSKLIARPNLPTVMLVTFSASSKLLEPELARGIRDCDTNHGRMQSYGVKGTEAAE